MQFESNPNFTRNLSFGQEAKDQERRIHPIKSFTVGHPDTLPGRLSVGKH